MSTSYARPLERLQAILSKQKTVAIKSTGADNLISALESLAKKLLRRQT